MDKIKAWHVYIAHIILFAIYCFGFIWFFPINSKAEEGVWLSLIFIAPLIWIKWSFWATLIAIFIFRKSKTLILALLICFFVPVIAYGATCAFALTKLATLNGR